MIRSPASPTTATAARPAIPGHLSPSQVANISAAAASANGWVSVNQATPPPDEPQQLDDEDDRFGGCGTRGSATPGVRTGRGCRAGRGIRLALRYGCAALD